MKNGKPILIFAICFAAAFAADQAVKLAILDGFRWESAAISIILTYNTGVAFSMFDWLGGALKYIQIALIAIVLIYVFRAKLLDRYGLPLGVLLGAGASNLFDRFIREGVVDFVHWHYWFDFAVFNLADVLIDCSIVAILYMHFFIYKKHKNASV